MSSIRKQYPFLLIEKKWQARWEQGEVFRAWNPGEPVPPNHPFARRHGERLPPKFYVLDMFPYPSGAGLHVGHPEGYTATDIIARYRRATGFNVLHPMGWDAFGLPAEQYAIKTGQHPRETTEKNIASFKRQIKSLGFSYDWNREIDTTAPDYYQWTQWIFLQFYHSWFNPATRRAEPIQTLPIPPRCDTAEKQRTYRDEHRLAYVSEAPVNWCPELGTVLANEEVINGRSEVGDFPVVRKPMRQWMLRITAYAERLLDDLDQLDWSHSLKEMQRNWIGRSEGAEVTFPLLSAAASPATGIESSHLGERLGGLLPLPAQRSGERARGEGLVSSGPEGASSPRPSPPLRGGEGESWSSLSVFTTRPDTLFGATYMVLAPEHPLTALLASPAQADTVTAYCQFAASKSDLERTDLAREKTGVFTGSYALNPANQEKIPVWVADYVLVSYGTGAIMAVPAHDERDLEFASKYHLPVRPVVQPPDDRPAVGFVGDGISIDSGFLTGLPTAQAKHKIIEWLEKSGHGRKTIQYKLRDWLFSRQRYWGEPFPIVWRDGHHEAVPEAELPVVPPDLGDFKPTGTGDPPLTRAAAWVHRPDGSRRETNTMPQWAGSCWYYLRYLDPRNRGQFCHPALERYWMQTAATAAPTDAAGAGAAKDQPGGLGAGGVDLYVGGTEHAVLHLLYARFWHKLLFDLGHVSSPEPFRKLVNQGLILGEDGQKMSKSRGNIVNPEEILEEYGADPFRLFEMFLGPLEMVKPWNSKGVEGVYRFLGRVWRLFVDEANETKFQQRLTVEPEAGPQILESVRLSPSIRQLDPSPEQLKVLHACIKKVTDDLDHLRFNTAISALMIFVNEAILWPIKPIAVMADFLKLLHPFAPHLAEELFGKLQGISQDPEPWPTLAYVPWPRLRSEFLAEATLEIPIQVNGKLRDKIVVPADISREELERRALESPKIQSFIQGRQVRKVIVVPRKLVNLVVD